MPDFPEQIQVVVIDPETAVAVLDENLARLLPTRQVQEGDRIAERVAQPVRRRQWPVEVRVLPKELPPDVVGGGVAL